MHRRSGLVLLALSSLALLSHPQSASGQEQAPAATFHAQARAVDVDVLVLDKHGVPVKGLRKEDFVVTEDGGPQTIAFFEEHTAADAGPDAATNVLLIDTLNTSQDDQMYVRQQVAAFLKKMPPGTSLAVFALGQNLRLVQGFTSDRSLLLAAVENNKTGAWSGTGATSNMPLDDASDGLREQRMAIKNPMAGSAGLVMNEQAAHKSYQNDQRIAMTDAALEQLAHSLAKTPGRKNLIWFSGSFPAALLRDSDPHGTLTAEQSRQSMETTNLLALARVALYPVQGQGVAAQTTGDTSDHFGTQQRPMPGPPTGAAAPSDTYQQNSSGDNYSYAALSKGLGQQDNAQVANAAAMRVLAAETGGEAMPPGNDLSGMLARAIQNGSQYYMLSYTPANRTADGSFRRIDVKLRNGSYRLAYRRGYYATGTMLGEAAGTPAVANTPTTPADPLTPLMRHGVEPVAEIPYDVHVEVTNPQPAENAAHVGGNTALTGPVTRYRVDFVILHGGEAPSPGSADPNRIQVEVIAYDRNGKGLNWQAGMMHLQPSSDPPGQRHRIHTSLEIDVPKDAASLSTGVYDWGTNKKAIQEITLDNAGETRTLTQRTPGH